MGEYREMLSDLDRDWQDAEVRDEFALLPDGKYQARVDVARLELNKEYNSLWLIWELIVINGEHADRKVFKRAIINDPEKVGWVKTDLYRAGIEPKYLSDLEDHLEDLLDRVLEIQLKTTRPNSEGKQYQNVYINKFLGMYDGSISDGDAPF